MATIVRDCARSVLRMARHTVYHSPAALCSAIWDICGAGAPVLA